ncbi:MAG: hypothetical protein ACKVH0_21675, partial [Alphaproteobacteria bacterium]
MSAIDGVYGAGGIGPPQQFNRSSEAESKDAVQPVQSSDSSAANQSNSQTKQAVDRVEGLRDAD